MNQDTPKTAPTAPTILAIVVLGAFVAVSLAALILPFNAGAHIIAWLDTFKHSAFAAPIAILGFAALASIGAPQVVLIPALVAVFGPWAGFFYAWTGKLIHCSLGFFVGRHFGASALERHAGPKLTSLMQQLAKRGFLASALIRLVPTVPSVIVNVAAGCAPIRFRDFILGTAIGSVPKMAVIAFAGAAAISGLSGGGVWAWAQLAIAALLLVLIAMAGRAWMRRLSRSDNT